MTRTVLLLLAVTWSTGGCRRRAQPTDGSVREATAEGLTRFRAFALEPARLPPPSLDPDAQAEGPGLEATARIVRPEDAAWNQAPDGDPVLFNDRWAWLVEVHLVSLESKPLSWVADRTTLELNDPDTSLSAAPLPDDVLGDLLFWALQEERVGLAGDLVARTRAAGAFRTRYLSRTGSDGTLDGLVAFPAAEVADTHVVAARLVMPVVHDGQTTTLTWVFH